MGVQNPNSTGYVHPNEPNLLNIHKAMTYDPASGEPHLRVFLGTDTLTIAGNVNVIDNVRVNNTAAQMIPVYIVGNTIAVTQSTSPWIVEGNANITGNISGITSLPAIRGNVWVNGITGNIAGITELPAITGNVDITRMPYVLGNVSLTGNLGAITQLPAISGNVWVNGITGNIAAIGQLPAVTGNVQIWDGGNSITIDGNVSITSMPAQNITGNVYVLNPGDGTSANVQYGDTIQMDPNDRLRVSVIGQQWWYVPSIDKDGDLRIQEAFQGTGTSTFIQNLASVRITSGLTYDANARLTGSAIRASRRRHKTRPGVGAEWLGIVNWDGLQTNVVKRIGLFTNYNGVFFEANATTVNAVVRRRLTDGTLVETRVPHTAWNLDTMNGTGPSGYNWTAPAVTANVTAVVSQANVAISGDGTVYQVTYQLPAGEETRIPVGKKVTLTGLSPTTFNDTGLVTSIDTVNHRANVAYIAYPGTYSSATNAQFTNTPFHSMHTYWFDFNGSRTSRVRFGMLTDRGKVAVHEFTAGEIGTQVFSAPALMDRKEVVNVGQPVDFLPSMTVGGSAVTIETSADINPGFGVARTTTATTFNKNSQVGSEFAVIGVGIRQGEPYQRSDLQVNKLQMVDLGNLNPQNAGIFQWRLVLNPTTSNAPTYTDVGKATHRLTYAQGTTVTGGIDLIDGYAQGTFTGDVSTSLNFLNMGSNIDYTDSDIVVLAVKMLVGGTDNSSVQATINYTEDL